VIGLFRMRDRGVPDFKILGVPHPDPLFNEIRDLDDVPRHFLLEVEHFFMTYKQLEGVKIESDGWEHARAAEEEVQASIRRYVELIARRAQGLLK
jgi:inorganic pyrophosphatase